MREEGAAALTGDAASQSVLQSLALDAATEDGATCA